MGDFLIDPEAVGLRLRALRGERTQAEFAEFVGSSRVTVSRYESGDRTPDAEFLLGVHTATGVDVIWLLTGSGDSGVPEELRLTAEEELLLEHYRAASKAVRKAALGALVGGTSGKVEQNFHAPVTNALAGDNMTNHFGSPPRKPVRKQAK